MQPNDLKRLKVAAEQFYLDQHQDQPTMSDREYDELAKQYEAETGKSVKTLIDWESIDKLEHIQDFPALSKIQVKDNDLMSAAKRWLDSTGEDNYYCQLKYDGCGLRFYYSNCRLQKVMSTPDEKFGQLKTSTLAQLAPQIIDDPTVESIAGELVVDPELFGFNSRSKSNGLVNSKNKLEDIKKYAMVRVYRVTYTDSKDYDYYRQFKTLSSLPELWDDNKCYFKMAPTFGISEIPKKSINDVTGESMQSDGIVVYTPSKFTALKFYYNDSAIAEVGKISYIKQKTSNLYPTLWFKSPVTIEGKNISKCAGGSLNTIKSKHIGVGAKVRVILSNSVIPKVLDVIEPSNDFQIPEDLKQYE